MTTYSREQAISDAERLYRIFRYKARRSKLFKDKRGFCSLAKGCKQALKELRKGE